ncbi:hypothetical protein [Fodinicola acaciae]|uniref:hypothetical protein n=1 Tax=Fodinicola acaciae TaxID=2681555 RepID=UPI0013D6E9CB|nr:hypothetical protein [Fodinicola acaciae]
MADQAGTLAGNPAGETAKPDRSGGRRRGEAPWLVLVSALGVLSAGIHLSSLLFAGRNLWLADSRFYLYFSLRFLGVDPSVADHQVRELSATVINLPTPFPLWEALNYPSFGGRPLFSLVSAPFVALLGPNGLLVVPFLAYAAMVPLVYLLLRRLVQPLPAVAVMALLLFSSPAIYLVMPLAESLSVVTITCWLFTLPWRSGLATGPVMTWQRLGWCFGTMLLAGVTRQLIAFAGAFIVFVAIWAWLQTEDVRRDWWKALGVSFAGLVATTVFGSLISHLTLWQFLKLNTQVMTNMHDALLRYPAFFGKALAGEGRWLLNSDAAMLLLVLVAGIGAFTLRRTIVPWLAASVLVGYLGTLLLSPYSTRLRLFLPATVFLLLAAAITLSRAQLLGRDPITGSPLVVGWLSRRQRHSAADIDDDAPQSAGQQEKTTSEADRTTTVTAGAQGRRSGVGPDADMLRSGAETTNPGSSS